jgi:hypothetical protein
MADPDRAGNFSGTFLDKIAALLQKPKIIVGQVFG